MEDSSLTTPSRPGRKIRSGLRSKQRVGKYKIERQIGSGGFSQVYSAMDTIEGVRVALKIPYDQHVDQEMLGLFRQEVRLVAKLDHPNILPLKNADMIDNRFVVATRLGNETLDSRLQRRISVERALYFAEQMIAAVAYAHDHRIIHCDIKPENFILFDDDWLRLTDFGIAKVSRITILGSGTGTVGHMAPEQAMGKPSFRSDVFSLGLIIYRMLSGCWPEYPFQWPPPCANSLRTKRVHPDVIHLIKKAIDPTPRRRFADAVKMEAEFERCYPVALRHLKKQKRNQ
jgi:serine/threonine-protein kinase